MPKISIIVPIYNVEKYLMECLESICAQSFQDYEVICVEGHSTDNSLSIVEKFLEIDSRFRIVDQKGKGLSGARNDGIVVAEGEYIVYLDSDDYLLPDALQEICNQMEDGDIDALCYNTELLYEDEQMKLQNNMDEYFTRKNEYSDFMTGSALLAELLKNKEFCAPVWLMAMKRQWLLANELFFEEGILHEDNLYSVQAYLSASNIRHINKSLYMYRIRRGSLANKRESCHELYSFCVVYRGLLRCIRKHDCSAKVWNQLQMYIRYIQDRCRKVSRAIPEDEKNSYCCEDEGIEDIFQILQVGKYEKEEKNSIESLAKFHCFLETNKTLIIYGAGMIGKLMRSYLLEMNMLHKVKCFLVSQESSQRFYEGIPIVTVQDFVYCGEKAKEAGVLLAVRNGLQQELQEMCNNYGLNNTFSFAREEQEYVKAYLEEKRKNGEIK